MRKAIQVDDSSEQISTLANTPKHRKVSEVASYIIANPSEAISLNNLAEHFYISKHYLSRIFKEVTGFTVSEYINIHRIKRAKELLLHTDYNISEVANLCGYESITYFERVFSKYTETSPLKYRNQYKKILRPVR
jgi:YesN/AraC family two-component response regulator